MRKDPMKCSRNIRRDLKYSNQDSFTFSVMVGAGETFLPAFALAIGFSQVASGMLSSTPLLIGSFLQLLTPWFVTRIGSYRKWVVGLAVLQAFAFLPLIFGAMKNNISGAA